MTNSNTQPHPTQPLPQKSDKASAGSSGTSGERNYRPLFFVIVSGVLILVVALFILLPLTAYGYFQFYGVIVPGVGMADLELGGLTWQEAKDGLDLVYGVDPELTLSDGRRNWIARASDFGLGWDTAAMALADALLDDHGSQSRAIRSWIADWSESDDSLSR